jgi:hemerythrin-like metal-binding protein
MTLISWQASYSVGSELMDTDHQLLVSLINQLDDAISGGHGSDVVGSVLRVLVEYTHSHFAREELLMEKGHYPNLTAHIAEHRKLTSQVSAIVERNTHQDGLNVDRDLLNFLTAWLTNHIAGSDKDYSAYIQGVELSPEEQLSAVEQINRPPT